jgi:hypothetical protein
MALMKYSMNPATDSVAFKVRQQLLSYYSPSEEDNKVLDECV